MPGLPQTKAELLQELQEARTALDQKLSLWSDDQLTGWSDPAGWSIKDHLDHLAVWEESVALLLERRPRADRFAAMGVDVATMQNSSEDEQNALIRERLRKRSLAETRSALRAAQEHLMRALETLTDADLFKTHSYYQPEVSEDSGRPILDWIVGNSSGHYREHLPWIESIAAQGNRI